MLDFSVLKNIDFTNKDNLIFLFIFLVIGAIIFTILWVIVKKIIKVIRIFFIMIFNVGVRKPEFDNINSFYQPKIAPVNYPVKAKVVGGDFISKPVDKGKQEKEIVQNYKSGPANFSDKEKNDIVEKLSGIEQNSAGVQKTETLTPRQPQPNVFTQVPSIDKNKINNSVIPLKSEKPEIPIPHSKSFTLKKEAQNIDDSSIFKGGPEIAKTKLEHEMKTDTGIWQAAKQEGLTLNSTERAELVKEVFTPAQGRNISKTDLKQSIKSLNKNSLILNTLYFIHDS